MTNSVCPSDHVNAGDILRFLNSEAEDKRGDYCSNFPPADIYIKGENEDTLVFEFAIAGYNPEDIKIVIANDLLEVSTDRKKLEKEDEAETEEMLKRKYSKQKIARRDFHLRYSLSPGRFALDEVKANHSNGILTIELPRSEESKPRSIIITPS